MAQQEAKLRLPKGQDGLLFLFQEFGITFVSYTTDALDGTISVFPKYFLLLYFTPHISR